MNNLRHLTERVEDPFSFKQRYSNRAKNTTNNCSIRFKVLDFNEKFQALIFMRKVFNRDVQLGLNALFA